MKLKVEYSGGNIDMKFDEEIREFFESKGFKWTGQGVAMIDGIRDICFERTSEDSQ